MEETGVPCENHRRAARHWQTLSHNVISSTPRYYADIDLILKADPLPDSESSDSSDDEDIINVLVNQIGLWKMFMYFAGGI
jgi:hypothetical protein